MELWQLLIFQVGGVFIIGACSTKFHESDSSDCFYISCGYLVIAINWGDIL